MTNTNASTTDLVPVCDWLTDARIFNHKLQKVNNTWLIDKVEVIVLYFSMKNTDRHDIMQKFCEIYYKSRKVKLRVPLPFEVINVPMDDTKKDMFQSYNNQAEWLTLRHGDPLIPILQYRYGITSVPHLLVLKTDGTVVSTHGILDLDKYGVNALLTWMSTAANRFKLNRDFSVFDFTAVEAFDDKPKSKYKRRYSEAPEPANVESSPEDEVSL